MAFAVNDTSQPANLSDFIAPVNAAKEIRTSRLSRSLAAVIDTHGDAVGAAEPGQYLQFDPAATDRGRIC